MGHPRTVKFIKNVQLILLAITLRHVPIKNVLNLNICSYRISKIYLGNVQKKKKKK